MASLSTVVEDLGNAANNFAKELQGRMRSQFSYLLDPKSKDFKAIFWVAIFVLFTMSSCPQIWRR